MTDRSSGSAQVKWVRAGWVIATGATAALMGLAPVSAQAPAPRAPAYYCTSLAKADAHSERITLWRCVDPQAPIAKRVSWHAEETQLELPTTLEAGDLVQLRDARSNEVLFSSRVPDNVRSWNTPSTTAALDYMKACIEFHFGDGPQYDFVCTEGDM